MATATFNPSTDPASLVRMHQGRVWRYLRYLGANPAQADDLMQETFLAFFKQDFEERSTEATAAYLRTTARRLFLRSLKKESRNVVLENPELAEFVWARFEQDDDGTTYVDALRECVEELDGRPRQAIDLFYRESRSRSDIGRELEMTEDGVKTLLRRTREVLRRCVERNIPT